MEYGLIGKSLGHSYSKLIHEKLDSKPYDLVCLNEDELEKFIKGKNFKGINVTIPYKKAVIPMLDVVSDEVNEIGACNAIVNKDGVLYGYNTDYFGLKKLIEDNKITIEGKNCYILGTGGTSNTAFKALTDLKAKSITKVSRSAKDNTITYEEFYGRKDVEIIINTTPVGMYPNVNDLSCDISSFDVLEGVVDVIYNPYNTRLLAEAKKRKIRCCGGLAMLVNQAIAASEYFLDKKYTDDVGYSIYNDLLSERLNVVLIGMPMSGKSTIGEALAKALNKTYIDTDKVIELVAGMDISSIFKTQGEEYFRKLEADVIMEVSQRNNMVISTGGGVIKNETNMAYLKANGFTVYLKRDFDQLVFNDKRPLARKKKDYENLLTERLPLYKKYKDAMVSNNTTVESCVKRIKEAFYESIDN